MLENISTNYSNSEGKSETKMAVVSGDTLHNRPRFQEDRTETIASSLANGSLKMSVVIPLLNEEDSLDMLYTRVKNALNIYAPNHEIVFVDDGSRDKSFQKLRKFWDQDNAITIIRFRRNFGKAAALSAGFKRVTGDIVMMMDADLQDQPEEIPNLVAKLDSGYDLVTGWKQKRHDPIGKTLPSKLFNRTVSGYFKLDLHDFNCGLKMMKAPVAQSIQLYGDFHRFIPVLAADKGFRVTECAVEHAPRVHGVSKYGAKRLVTGLFDFCTSVLMTKFNQKPLHFFGSVGLATTFLGIFVGMYLFIQTLLGQGGHIRPLWVVMTVLLLGGIQIFFTGLIMEMLANIAQRDRAQYELDTLLESRI